MPLPTHPPPAPPQLLAIPIRAYLKSVVGNIYFCIVLLTHLLYEFPMAEMMEACFLLRTEQWKRNTTLTCIYWSRNWRNEISDRSGKHGLFVSIFRLGLVYYYYYCCYYYYCYYLISFQGTFRHMMQKDRRKSNLNLIFQIDAQKCIKRIKKKKKKEEKSEHIWRLLRNRLWCQKGDVNPVRSGSGEENVVENFLRIPSISWESLTCSARASRENKSLLISKPTYFRVASGLFAVIYARGNISLRRRSREPSRACLWRNVRVWSWGD